MASLVELQIVHVSGLTTKPKTGGTPSVDYQTIDGNPAFFSNIARLIIISL